MPVDTVVTLKDLRASAETRATGRGLVRALLVTAVLAACARPPQVRPPMIDPVVSAAVFDSVWSRVAATYHDSTMRGVDWSGARDDLRPFALRARTNGELRAVLAHLLERLGESHFAIVPGDALGHVTSSEAVSDAAPGDVGISLRLLNGELVVVRVDSGSAAHRSGVRAGWTLLAVDSTHVRAAVRAAADARLDARIAAIQIPGAFENRLRGAAGAPVYVTFGDEGNGIVKGTLLRGEARGEIVRFAFLPPLIANFSARAVERDGRCVGVVQFNVWLPAIAPAFDSAMTRFSRCAGIVVDLRGNPGGIAAMVMGIGGYFLERPDSLGVLRMRTATLRFFANPRRVSMSGAPMAPFAGRLAVAIDERSASTSEIFAAAMRRAGRARIFGRRSPGFAQPASLTRLPNGDALMHVIADFTLPDGTRIEANGVVPDVEVPLSRSDLIGGRDRTLDDAVAWASGSN